jgi:hypothetical protein
MHNKINNNIEMGIKRGNFYQKSERSPNDRPNSNNNNNLSQCDYIIFIMYLYVLNISISVKDGSKTHSRN